MGSGEVPESGPELRDACSVTLLYVGVLQGSRPYLICIFPTKTKEYNKSVLCGLFLCFSRFPDIKSHKIALHDGHKFKVMIQ